MTKVKLNIFQFLVLILYINYVKLVPHKYCLSPLNKSDCGKQATAVFSYYKPGSRCEIETWRGCPTANMFENEYHCSHYCIGRLKFFGQDKGFWTRDLDESINDLSTNELKGLDLLLHKANDQKTYDSKEIKKITLPAHPNIIEDTTGDTDDEEDADDPDYGTVTEEFFESTTEVIEVTHTKESTEVVTYELTRVQIGTTRDDLDYVIGD